MQWTGVIVPISCLNSCPPLIWSVSWRRRHEVRRPATEPLYELPATGPLARVCWAVQGSSQLRNFIGFAWLEQALEVGSVGLPLGLEMPACPFPQP